MAADAESPDPERIGTQADFGRELRALRERADQTIRQVARAADIPVSTAGDYFSGKHLPARTDLLERVLRACGESDSARVDRWREALRRARRAPGRRTDRPYRGLARFEKEDARWFFGREDVTDTLTRLTSGADGGARAPLMLVGPSGAGKSSLLRAGLLPRLTGPVSVFEPTPAPAADFKACAARLAVTGRGPGPGSGRPTLIVDQFEAVFTLCPDEDQRRAFIADICELARDATVTLALRADFYDYAIRYPTLADALQSRQVVLGPMTSEQIRRAITEPARVAKANVEDGLVELLLSDLPPDEPGALPLLSHAMFATWENSRGGTLTVADYLASGGIRNALAKTAERVLLALTEPRRQLARRLFLRLVHVADGLPPSRAIVPLSELRETTDPELLSVFVAERLITVDAGTAAITHDALLTEWPRLREWIEADMDGLRIRRRVTESARTWQEAGREDAALWRGSQLAVVREWAARGDSFSSLPPLAAEFVAASVAEEAAHERAQRRRTTRLQAAIATLTALAILIGGLSVYAFQQRHTAAVARDQALSGEIALEAVGVRAHDPALAAQLSGSAYDIMPTRLATASLLESSGTPSAAPIVDSSGIVECAVVSPDGTLLAAAGADGTLRLWNVRDPGHPTAVASVAGAGAGRPLYTAAFSPDGRILAAAGAARTVKLWDITDPARPRYLGALAGPAGTVYSVAFSARGGLLAAGSATGTVRLWDVSDPSHARPAGKPLAGPAGPVQSVAFSPSGATLAAGTGDASAPGGAGGDAVWIWDVSRPARPSPLRGMPLTGPASVVSGVAFSPDGKTLAAASHDHKVWLWTVNADRGDARPDGTLTGATNWANTVSFSPDGQSVAAGTSDADVLVWKLATRALTAKLPQAQPVTSVAWDGPRHVTSGDADGTVSLWSLPTPVLSAGDSSTSLAYSPDGGRIAVGGTNVELWDSARREMTARLPLRPGTLVNGIAYAPHGRYVAVGLSDGTARILNGASLSPVSAPFRVTASGNAESVAFSPNGRTLATGSDDGTVRLWSLADPARPRLLASVRDSGTYVYTITFAPDGKTLAAASVDNLTRLWGVADPARPRLLGRPLGGLASYAIGLAFSPDGGLLAIGSADRTVQLWNVRASARPTRLATLTGPSGYVWATAFSPDGKTLAAGVTTGAVWLWNVADPARPALITTLTGPAGHVYSVAFSPSGSQVAATSDDGTVHLWDSTPSAAKAAVCANLGQPITRKEWSAYLPGVPYHAPCP